MRRLVILIMCLAFFISGAMAQSKKITGKVVDEKGNAVPNASILVKGTKSGTSTLSDGTFSLSVPSSAKVLVITSIGFTSQDISIVNKTNVMVTLLSASQSLDEVVVTGYGGAKKKAEITGSVATIAAPTLQDKPVANMIDALQGKAAGVQVYTSSGEPSTTPSIRLNGVGSLGASSTPLFVMDGIPIDIGTVLSLNPEDFESISILRDASATSIYGSRAANGVIILTSKKGSVRNAKISLTAQYGSSSLTNNTLDLYKSFMNTKQFTDFLVASGIRTQAQVNTTLATYHADTRWYQVYFKPSAPVYSIDLNVSGGSGKTSYYLSGSYFNQEGLEWRSGYKRYTVRANLNTVLNNWFQMGITTLGGYDERQTNGYNTNNLNRGLSQLGAPYYSNKDSNGVEYPDMMPGINLYNPKYLAAKYPSVSNNIQLNPTGYIQINPVKNLTIKTTAGIEFFDYRTTSYRLPSFIGSLNSGQVTESFSRGTTRTITNTVEYKFAIANRHNFTVLGGQEFINNTSTGFTSSSSGQSDDRLLLLSAGPSSITASSSKSEYAYLSYFGRLSYNLNSKYFVDLTVRNDQSSRFGRNLSGATFYSVGAMWAAKKENFFKSINWLTELTFKASIGTSGNSSIGNYDNLATVSSSTSSAYNTATGWYIATAGNSDLSWEKQRQINVGFQTTVFKKLHVEAEFFHRLTTSMLMSVPYPYTSGFSSVTSNVGGLRNSGINANISYDVIDKKDALFSVYANFGYVQQKVTSLFQGKQYWIVPNTGVCYAIGQPVSYFYPIFSQIDPATGNPLWYNPNSDPNKIVNTNKDVKNVTNTFNSTALQQNTGIKRYAPFNGGFGFNGSYKSFSVAADFTFSQGKYMINNDEYFFNNPYQFAGYNQVVEVLNYWKKPGDVTRYPKAGVQFTQFDSRLIENASFIRLKNITFAYNLPKSLLSKTKVISGFRFFVTLRNIWTLTKYAGPDPEVDANLSVGAYPNTKQTSVGLNIQF